MTAAPYFHTQFTEEASKELTEQVQQRFLNVVENLSKTLGLNVRQVFDNLGGFYDDKLNSQVRELSYTIEFDDADIDKINLFTCLLGDLGHEVQNSVYNIRYTDKDDTNANGIEHTLKCDTSDRHKLADKLEKLGIDNYSIDRDGIHMLYFNGDNEADFQEKWKKVLENIEGEVGYQKIHSNYFDAAERAKLYDEELKKFGEEEKELENEELKPLKEDNIQINQDLRSIIQDIADRLGWDDNTKKTYFDKFRGISYEKQKQIGDDLYNISMEPGSDEEVQSKVDKYIQKLEEELKASEEKNAPKSEEELKKSEKDNVPKSKRIEELKKYGEEELKKAGKDKLQLKEDLLDIIITIADELGSDPKTLLSDIFLSNVSDIFLIDDVIEPDKFEKVQDSIIEGLNTVYKRAEFLQYEIDYYSSGLGHIDTLLDVGLDDVIIDIVRALNWDFKNVEKVEHKFYRFSLNKQDKFAKELGEIYKKYKDNKQELQSQFDKYIDNLNVELKKLEEDGRRKESNEQRVIEKNGRVDEKKASRHKVGKQDRRLHQLLNEALETNQKYRDSGGTEAIQTGETLKEGTNAITPGQTYEDYVKENQDGVAYFEAFIPVYDSIFKEFASREGTISVEALEYLHPDIMKMIVYRIPTEGRHSIMPVKGIQFMPIEMGGTIMLPDEMIHLLKQTI